MKRIWVVALGSAGELLAALLATLSGGAAAAGQAATSRVIVVLRNQERGLPATPRGAPGLWDMAPDVVGPFGGTGATQEPVNTSLAATTPAFDPAISSPPGDLWATSLNPSASFGTVIVDPGKSATIPVTITLSGPAGTVVSGTLYLDDASLVDFGNLIPNGNQVAAFPYTYTIG